MTLVDTSIESLKIPRSLESRVVSKLYSIRKYRIKVELVSKYSHWAQLEPKEGPIAVGLLSGQDNLRKSRVRNYLF